MKIAISGTQNSGKSTLINKFVNVWKNYKTPTTSYREILKEKGLSHSKETTEETQTIILDSMIEQMEQNKDEKYIVYDRSVLDCLVYAAAAAEQGKISDEFMDGYVERVRNALSMYDAIFILPYNENIPIEDNGVRDTDIDYIKKIDSIFQNIVSAYWNSDRTIFPEDCPGIILLEGDNKIGELKTILNKNGELMTAEEERQLQREMMGIIGNDDDTKRKIENIMQVNEKMIVEDDVSLGILPPDLLG